jgi:hypothetical protein
MTQYQKLASVAVGTVLSLSAIEVTSLPSYGTVLEPGSSFAGHTLGEWSADWWTTVLETPFDQNPVANADPDGNLTTAFNDPSNPVFYLTGVLLPDLVPVNRQVTVTEGKGIFFPLINTVNILDPSNPQTVEELRAEAAAVIDGVDSLFATIDGVEIPNLFNRREQSPTFNVNLPDGNLFGVTPGVYGPSVSDGYWAMVTDLTPGEYTISFGGSVGDFVQDSTYTVNVVPVPEPSTLGFIGVGILGLLAHKRQQQ